MDELLSRPIQLNSGLLMGLKAGTTNTAQAIEVIAGSAKVQVGPASQARNRNLAAVAKTYAAATNSATWAAGSLISSLEVSALLPADSEEKQVITTLTTTTPFTGAGKLRGIFVSSLAITGTITVYDAATATGTPIAIITAGAAIADVFYELNAFLTTGLTIVTAVGAVNATAMFKQGGPIGYAVINAPSDAVATAWLADTGGATVDVQYFPIFKDRPTEISTVLGSDNSGEITRIDISTTINLLNYYVRAN